MKYGYSEAEIEDFKLYMHQIRRFPREEFLKAIDRWKKHCLKQEKLMLELSATLIRHTQETNEDVNELLARVKKLIRKDLV